MCSRGNYDYFRTLQVSYEICFFLSGRCLLVRAIAGKSEWSILSLSLSWLISWFVSLSFQHFYCCLQRQRVKNIIIWHIDSFNQSLLEPHESSRLTRASTNALMNLLRLKIATLVAMTKKNLENSWVWQLSGKNPRTLFLVTFTFRGKLGYLALHRHCQFSVTKVRRKLAKRTVKTKLPKSNFSCAFVQFLRATAVPAGTAESAY